MKIKNLKYIFSCVFFYAFLCYSFALEPVSSPSQCNLVNGYYLSNGQYNSTQSSQNPQGNVHTPGILEDPNWFYNNINALIWRYQDNNLGGNNATEIITKKLSVIRYFDSSAGYDNWDSVWHLQDVLSNKGHPTERDCKLGRDTCLSFFSSDLCHKVDNSYTDPESWDPLSCGANKEFVSEGPGEGLCCKPEEEPEITIEPEITEGTWDGDTMRGINVSFEIDGYEGNGSDIQIDNSKISVAGGSIDGDGPGCNYNDGCVSCDFDVYVQDNSATLNINEGVVKIGNNKSSSDSKEISKEDPEDPDDPEVEPENLDCDHPIGNDGDCQDVYGGYFAFDDESNCCIQQGECQRPPDDSGNCEDGYANDAGCCSLASLVCTGIQYSQGGGNCTDCSGGTVPNESHTKCICDSSVKCCGIKLNTVVPFIGDCIELDTDSSRSDTTSVNSVTAFPILMQGLMKIVMSVIMVFSFIMLIVAGLMMTAGAFKNTSFDKGKTILKNVIISLILLGCSGLILSLINPSFFGG